MKPMSEKVVYGSISQYAYTPGGKNNPEGTQIRLKSSPESGKEKKQRLRIRDKVNY
jgi:hypothetical protein